MYLFGFDLTVFFSLFDFVFQKSFALWFFTVEMFAHTTRAYMPYTKRFFFRHSLECLQFPLLCSYLFALPIYFVSFSLFSLSLLWMLCFQFFFYLCILIYRLQSMKSRSIEFNESIFFLFVQYLLVTLIYLFSGIFAKQITPNFLSPFSFSKKFNWLCLFECT